MEHQDIFLKELCEKNSHSFIT